MAAEIATAYVRIRPQLSGFRTETESGVKGALTNVNKIIGGAFAAVGAFEFGKHLIESASEHQAAFAVLDRTIKNAGASVRGFGVDLESTLAKEARLKGFSDEQLAAGLTTLVSVTHNTAKAYHDLGLAEDLARARHKDLTVAALALARAEQGSTTTLSRFGIKVQEVTVNVDRLKKIHDDAAASGAKFSGQQALEYKALLEQAKATDKLATRQEALRLVQQRFGGVAGIYAKTAAGEYARFQQSVHQLEVSLSLGLLPALAHVTGGVASYIGGLATSGRLQRDVRQGAHDIGQALGVVRSIAETVGPPLLTVARAGAAVAHALGAGPIITAVIAYKGLVLAVEKAAALETLYQRVVQAGQAAKAEDAATSETQVGIFTRLNLSLHGLAAARAKDAEAANLHAVAAARDAETTGSIVAAAGAATGGVNTLTGALVENTVAAEADATATAALVTIYGPLGGALATVGVAAGEAGAGLGVLAGEEVAVGVGAGVAATGGIAALASGIGRLALGAVGGPVGAALLGLAALAGGIYYLVSRESDAERATKALGKALDSFGSGLKGQADATRQVADARNALASDRAAVTQARLNLEQSRSALHTTSAARGTQAYRAAVANSQSALAAYHSSLQQVRDDLARLSDVQGQAQKTTRDTAASFRTVEATSKDLRKALDLPFRVFATGERGAIDATATLANVQAHASDIADKFAAGLQKIVPGLQQTNPLIAHNTQLLIDYVQQVGHVPTEKVTKVILSTPNLNATLAEIDAKLKSLDPNAYADGRAIGVLFGQGVLAGVQGVENPFANAFTAFGNKVEGLAPKLQAQIRKALSTGVFSTAQIAKQFGVTTAQVAAVEKQAQDLADARAAAIKKAALKPISIPDVEALIPYRIKLEEAGASTDAQQRKAISDKIAFLNKELGRNLTEATRQNITLERASLQAQLDQLNAAAKQAGLTTAATIDSTQKRISDAILSAKKNLDHIGDLLAASVDKFLKKTGSAINPTGSPVTAAYQHLLTLLKSGAGSSDIARAAAALQNQVAANPQSGGNQQQALRDQFHVLATRFEKTNNVAQFNRGVSDLLKRDHVTIAAVRKALGPELGDRFANELKGFREQAVAIHVVPQRLRQAVGSGETIKIVRPLEIIQQQGREAAIRAERQRERQIKAANRAAHAAEGTNALLKAGKALRDAKNVGGDHNAKASKHRHGG